MRNPHVAGRWWTRRDVLKGAGAAAAYAAGWPRYSALAAPIPDKYDGTAFKLAAPEPNAKPGGDATIVLVTAGRAPGRLRCG